MSDTPRSGTGTPTQAPTVPIPNIPLQRREYDASPGNGRSLGTSVRASIGMNQPASASASSSNFPSRTNSSANPAGATIPTPSADDRARSRSVTEQLALGKKSPVSMSEASQAKSSGLAARLAASPGTGSEPVSRPGSGAGHRADASAVGATGGASTPVTGGGAGDSSFSNLADVPDEEKARVLGRHLMSARERRGSQSQGKNSPYGVSPAMSPGVSAGLGSASMRAEQVRGDNGLGRASNSSLRTARQGDGAGSGNGSGSGSGKAKDDGESAADDGDAAASQGEGDYGTMGQSFHIPYEAHGVDVTHDLYKWQQDHQPAPPRSASFSHLPIDRTAMLDSSLVHIREPGGFRRNFVVNRAHERGEEPPSVVRNVVDFLFLYGHFAGEDLDEDDDDDLSDSGSLAEEDEDEDADADNTDNHSYLPNREGVYTPTQLEAREGAITGNTLYTRRTMNKDDILRTIHACSGERQPLLRGETGLTFRSGRSMTAGGGAGGGPGTLSRGQSKMGRHRRMKSGPPVGTASVTQAVLMLLKGFVGTGILFMGKAFFNGGLLFSTIVLLGIAAISLWAFLLLTQSYLVVPGSFGDIGGVLYGNWVRLAILASIAVSQIGFVAAYTIFIAQNLQAFILAVTECRVFIETKWLIFAELILFMPLAMIRNLAKLSGTALVADAFILIGIIYIAANETSVLAAKGLADVAMFNAHNFPLFIGTAVFTFEGIGLIIPITESMKEPHKFPRALSGVMLFVSLLFAGAGAMGYMAYGSKVQTVVLVNLPQDNKFVQAVQFLYSIAILLSIPLQLFPAVRIMENGIFSRSGKHNPSVKWQKNVFRAACVIGCSLLSWAGSQSLDKFVSLIGSFACIPLCFIYPPMLHLRACAKTRTAKALDIALLVFGLAICGFTTVQTIRSLAEPAGAPPVFGKCTIPQGKF